MFIMSQATASLNYLYYHAAHSYYLEPVKMAILISDASHIEFPVLKST